MSNKSLSMDPRIIPLVRSLKEKAGYSKENKPMNKITPDLSSEKTSENSDKLKESNNNKINSKNHKKEIKSKGTHKRLSGKSNTLVRKKSSAKISIDGSIDNKIKNETKSKEKNFNQTNIFKLYTGNNKQKHDNYNYNKIKTRAKYVQNLMSDMSLKKYKQSCIDLIKNDNLIKKLYEKAGLEKTNYSYEVFLQNNFFNQPLFMYKLEMLFFDESNFNKKNFKENFFKNEIVKQLEHINNEIAYKTQMDSLQDVFKNGFNIINNFNLFHE